MDAPANILLIRLKSIGDVLFTLPAVHRIRETFPGARITFLTSSENAPLLEGFREVNAVIPLDRAALGSGNPFRALPEFFGLLRRVRAGKFSLVVDFQGYGETGWLTRFTGAPQRWGRVCRRGRGWTYTRGCWRDNNIHPADWNLSLLAQCGLKVGIIRNEFVLPESALEEARRVFAAENLDDRRPTLFIQPFSNSPLRIWQMEKYLELAGCLGKRGVQILFGGGPNDRAALEPARAAGFCVVAGTPLLVSAGLVKLSTLTIGGVTGLLHLAVAMQKRAVMLAGCPGTNPRVLCRHLPYQHRDWAVVPPSGGNVSEVEVGAVLAACERAFSEPAGNVSC